MNENEKRWRAVPVSQRPEFWYTTWYDLLPPKELEVCPENYDLFWKTMYERQWIWRRRCLLNMQPPWTEDPYLKEFKFTNVYRELDRASQWLIRNILLDHAWKEGERVELVWEMMLFRFFNNPVTWTRGHDLMGWSRGVPTLDEYDEEQFVEFIRILRKEGTNPFTNAYLINSMAAPGHSRDYCYTRVVVPALRREIGDVVKTMINSESPEEVITCYMRLPAVATFIAHEFYQDAAYVPRYCGGLRVMPWGADDFTNVGPGADLGIRLIFPSLPRTRRKEGIYRLRDAADEALHTVAEGYGGGLLFPYLEWNADERVYYTTFKCNITLHQIEMWLCEFQKYWKMMIGQGKQRSAFKPTPGWHDEWYGNPFKRKMRV